MCFIRNDQQIAFLQHNIITQFDNDSIDIGFIAYRCDPFGQIPGFQCSFHCSSRVTNCTRVIVDRIVTGGGSVDLNKGDLFKSHIPPRFTAISDFRHHVADDQPRTLAVTAADSQTVQNPTGIIRINSPACVSKETVLFVVTRILIAPDSLGKNQRTVCKDESLRTGRCPGIRCVISEIGARQRIHQTGIDTLICFVTDACTLCSVFKDGEIVSGAVLDGIAVRVGAGMVGSCTTAGKRIVKELSTVSLLELDNFSIHQY